MFAFTFKGGWSPHLCVNCEVLEQDMIHAHGETIHQVTFHEPLKLPSASRISKQTKTRIQSKNTITLFHNELPCCMLFCSYSQKASTLRGCVYSRQEQALGLQRGEKNEKKKLTRSRIRYARSADCRSMSTGLSRHKLFPFTMVIFISWFPSHSRNLWYSSWSWNESWF